MTTPTLREAAPTDAQIDALWAEACKRDQPTRDMVRAFARAAIAAAHPQQPAPLTPREAELIDGMIARELDHAARCDGIGNRLMGEKQKGWDMERVALLRKLAGIVPAPTTDQSHPQRCTRP